MGKIYQVVVNGLRAWKMFINLCNTEEHMKKMTVKHLKEKITEMSLDYKGKENIRLIFAHKILDGDIMLLSDYGIQHMSMIRMMIKRPGGGGEPLPERKGMGEKTGKTRLSMEKLSNFQDASD